MAHGSIRPRLRATHISAGHTPHLRPCRKLPRRPERRKTALAFIFSIVRARCHRPRHRHSRCCPSSWRACSAATPPRAAEIYGLFGTAWAVMQFVSSPLLGAMSGPLRPPSGAAHFDAGPGPRLRLDGAGTDPCPGCSSAASYPASRRRASRPPMPTSPTLRLPEKRAGAFGLVGAAFGVGFGARTGAGRDMQGCSRPSPRRSGSQLPSVLPTPSAGMFLLPESLCRVGAAHALQLGTRQSGGIARVCSARTASCWDWRAWPSLSNLAHAGAAVGCRPLRQLSLRLERPDDGADAGSRRRGVRASCKAVLIQPIIAPVSASARRSIGWLLFGTAGFAVYGLADDQRLVSGPAFLVMALWGVAGAACAWAS